MSRLRIWFIAILLIVSTTVSTTQSRKVSAVIGGKTDQTSKSIVVGLYYEPIKPWKTMCSGVVIAPTWVLTAAHCVFENGKIDPYARFISVATTDGFTGVTSARSPALSIVVFPGYDEGTNRGDIALIKVNDVFGGSLASIATDAEVGNSESTFSTAMAVGFGRISQNGPTSTVGLEVPLTLWSQTECQRQWSYAISYFSGFICSQGKTSAAVCSGDSGGPLFVTVSGQRKLAGILSFGSAAGCGINLSVHTRVNTYIDFLRQYALGSPVVIIPDLPVAPTQPITDVELPTLPTFTASRPINLPKFSISRIFQLVLIGANRCSIYVDSATSLKGSPVRIFLGRTSTKPIKMVTLDEFGDAEFKSLYSCASIRKNGIYIARTDSSVKTQAIE